MTNDKPTRGQRLNKDFLDSVEEFQREKEVSISEMLTLLIITTVRYGLSCFSYVGNNMSVDEAREHMTYLCQKAINDQHLRSVKSDDKHKVPMDDGSH